MLDRLPRCKRKRACVSSTKRDSARRETIVHIVTKKIPGEGAPAERPARVRAEKVKREASPNVDVRPLETNLTCANSTSKDGAAVARIVPFDTLNLVSTIKKVRAKEVIDARLHM